MKRNLVASIVIGVCASLSLSTPASAQFAVIDFGAITQLLIEVQQLAQALQVAQNTLAQAQQAYAAITGGRGMELLLGGIVRNYLPANWAQLLNGAGPLGADVAATIQRNSILPADVTGNFSPAETQVLTARRSAVAL